MRDRAKAGIAAATMILLGTSTPEPAFEVAAPVQYRGVLSVMTFNVKGLPWPVATGRGVAIQKIGARLRRLRNEGRAPHVILLQEAFTESARAIGTAGGYRYVATGPGSDQLSASATGVEAGSWWKGETEGKLIGSGLEIASDFPIVGVRRLAFGQHACAGYDCLANKGALLVRIRLPGDATQIDILDTHLNSRHASGVSVDRADRAYAMQVIALEKFIRGTHRRRFPLIVGGDFNVGTATTRHIALAAAIAGSWRDDGPVRDALHDAADRGIDLPPDARESMRRAKDWQFFSARRTGNAVTMHAIRVPFGRELDGSMLSDHIGYIADYRLPARQHRPRRQAST